MKTLLILLCMMLSSMATAQNDRIVNGVILDNKGTPIAGAKVSGGGGQEAFTVGQDGKFAISLSPYIKMVEASCEGYLPMTLEIDGSYLIFKLKVDKKYAETKQKEAEAKAKAEEAARIAAEIKAREEAEAKARAEEAARIAAEKERLAAEKKAKEEAEAKARAEEAARIAAEKERLAEEKKAKEEAEAKAKAEEAARIAAEKERLAAEKKAKEEAAAKAKAEEAARIAAEKKRLAAEKKAKAEAAAKAKAEDTARKAAEKEKSVAERTVKAEAGGEKSEKKVEKVKVESSAKGLTHSLEFSYGYTLGGGDLLYKNLGFRQYGNTNPAELTYIIAYRFSDFISLGVGGGVSYDFTDLRQYGDYINEKYLFISKYTPMNYPLFANLKIWFTRGRVQPMFSLSGGVYAPNWELRADAGIGLNIKLGDKSGMYILASVKTTPYGTFIEPEEHVIGDRVGYYYNNGFAITPGIRIGFEF